MKNPSKTSGFRRVVRALVEKNKVVRNKGYFAVVCKLNMPYTTFVGDNLSTARPTVFENMSEAMSKASEIEKNGGYAKVVNCVIECERYVKPKYFTCVLCGGEGDDVVNNASPLYEGIGSCCNSCNATKVVPERMKRIKAI